MKKIFGSNDGNIQIAINVNDKDVDRTTKSIQGLGNASDSAISKIKNFAVGIGAFKLLSGAINLVKGSLDSAFKRIDTMEQFDRVMTSITGSSDEAARALETTNQTVKGTAYGLDVAAQAVQNFVTRGMEVDQATDTIAAWGDAVAFYGDGSNEQLSSVSDALSKMVTKGKVEMDQMNRLFDAGIPAVDIYADAVGMSTDEVQKQLASGEISAEQFVSVMNDAFREGTDGFASIEGAAKDAGATWGATFDNMKAAVSRGVVSIIESIDELLEDNGLPTMREMVSNFGSHFEDVLNNVAEAVGKFGQPFAEALTEITELFSGDAGGLQNALETLVPRMVEWIEKEIPLLLESGLEMVESIALGISESSIGLKDSALELIGALVNGIMETMPMIFETGFQIVETLMNSFIEKYPELLQSAANILMTISEGFLDNLPMIIETGMLLIDTLVEGIISFLPVINETALEIITSFLDIFVENMPNIINAGIDLLLALVDGIIEVMPEVGRASIETVETFLTWITNNLPDIVEKGKELLLKLVYGIADRMPEITKQAIAIMTEFLRMILDKLPDIIEAGVKILLSLVEGIVKSIFRLDNTISEIGTIILDGFGDISLWDIGSALIKGLWGGISAMGGWLHGKVSGFAGNVVTWTKNRLGVHSPSRVFRDEIGKMIPAGIELGMEAGEGDLKRSTDNLIDKAFPIQEIQSQLGNLILNAAPVMQPATSDRHYHSVSSTSNTYNSDQKFTFNANANGTENNDREFYERLFREFKWYIQQESGAFN